MSQNLSSAAVVIGALRVDNDSYLIFAKRTRHEIGCIETDQAWSSSLEDVRIMVRHEACPPGGNLVLMCAVVSNSASAVQSIRPGFIIP